MKIGVLGAGYVGLVTGTCLADMGNVVSIVDIDKHKIATLKLGKSPHYEPGLDLLLERNMRESRISFSCNISDAVSDKDVVILAIGTPMQDDGSADLSYIFSAVDKIAEHIDKESLIIIKSTVPVGTNQKIFDLMRSRKPEHNFHIVSNPEFLKEGAAVDDFMKPDRIVVGARCDYSRRIIERLYAPFLRNGHQILFMDPESAEMVKYASNAFLATKISFMNEMSRICEKVGADIQLVRHGMGADTRIGKAFLYSGLGYGGSCLPKDVCALANLASENGIKAEICNSVDSVNKTQPAVLISHIISQLGEDLTGKKIAIWGVAFKPQTDDVRYAPALEVINQLAARSADVTVFDPVALDNAKLQLGDTVSYAQSEYHALDEADALVICTEWNEFRSPDFDQMKAKMKRYRIFDGRNLYSLDVMKEYGFDYFSVGRKAVKLS